MKPRPALLAVMALLLVAGCRAAGLRQLDRPEPSAARPALAVEEFVARINQNAQQVQSLKARPEITVVVANREHYGVSGRMALERPRNFRLELTSGAMVTSKEADIGSNDKVFWFWVKDREHRRDEPRQYLAGRYDESGATPLAIAFQPDWIIEALGLREIPPEEAKAITVRRGPGKDAGRLYLTQPVRAGDRQAYAKVMVIDEATRQIRELRLYDKDQKTLLAWARMSDYRSIDGKVTLPGRVELNWVPEQLALIVNLGRPQLNTPNPPDYFEEPKFPGYARVDITDQAGLAKGPATVRETRPAPPSGVRLDVPEPIDHDSGPTGSEPLGALAAPAGHEAVVGAQLPTVPDPRIPAAPDQPQAVLWGQTVDR
jgi:hypothetical protein